MNSAERNVMMANQIAKNFAHMDMDDAAAATADHIHMFWDPRMKALAYETLAQGGDNFTACAARAIEILKEQGAPAHQTRATEFGPGKVDAG